MNKLQLTISSFSYKKGLPTSTSEHGGGFIFDCRAVHNPGRYQEYKEVTGKDLPVIRFFEQESTMHQFLKPVFSLINMSLETYLQRHFTHIEAHFGCTGGQHRSVYAAEQLKSYVEKTFPSNVEIHIHHREQPHLNHSPI